MGTNFYTETGACRDACEHCAENVRLHIGKSSMGWKFIFCSHPELGLTSWVAWQKYLQHREIRDEYGNKIALIDFRNRVENRREGALCRVERSSRYTTEYHDQDNYDFIEGEFS